MKSRFDTWLCGKISQKNTETARQIEEMLIQPGPVNTPENLIEILQLENVDASVVHLAQKLTNDWENEMASGWYGLSHVRLGAGPCR